MQKESMRQTGSGIAIQRRIVELRNLENVHRCGMLY